MPGCLPSVLVWLAGTVAMFWVGASADFQTVALIMAVSAVACFALQLLVWLQTRARHRSLAAEYVRLFGPLPEETKAWGTRTGGTAGRLLGGSTGYVVGGLLGAAVDSYNERQKYRDMSEPQVALLQELNRLQLVQPLQMSVMMVGALIGSWLLVVVVEFARSVVGL